MLEDDGNVIDEFTTMCSSIKSTLQWGGGGSVAVQCSSLHAGKVSFDTKSICLNEFCPGLS